MTRIYSDPSREEETFSLPDIEVFHHDGKRVADGDCWANEDGEPLPAGWYWWTCFPGCLPDSDPRGPFDSEEEAISDAQDACFE